MSKPARLGSAVPTSRCRGLTASSLNLNLNLSLGEPGFSSVPVHGVRHRPVRIEPRSLWNVQPVDLRIRLKTAQMGPAQLMTQQGDDAVVKALPIVHRHLVFVAIVS